MTRKHNTKHDGRGRSNYKKRAANPMFSHGRQSDPELEDGKRASERR